MTPLPVQTVPVAVVDNDDEIFGAAEDNGEVPTLRDYRFDYPERQIKTLVKNELRFHPLAALKALIWLHGVETEISGFAVTDPENPFYILDLHSIPQICTKATTDFKDPHLAVYLKQRQEKTGQIGMPPIWVHTHPGFAANPSSVDETTFAKYFSSCKWSIMCILSQLGSTARHQEAGHPLEVQMRVKDDWESLPYLSTDIDITALKEEWMDEVTEDVEVKKYTYTANQYNYKGNNYWNGYNYKSDQYNDQSKTQQNQNVNPPYYGDNDYDWEGYDYNRYLPKDNAGERGFLDEEAGAASQIILNEIKNAEDLENKVEKKSGTTNFVREFADKQRGELN